MNNLDLRLGIAAALLCVVIGCGGSAPGAPARTIASLEIVSGDAQTSTAGSRLPLPIAVRAIATDGAPLQGVRVDFLPAPGSGSLSTGSVSTAADGKASVQWALGIVAGAQSMTAAASGAPSVSFKATAVAGPAASLSVSTPASLLVGGTQQLSVVAKDIYLNATAMPENTPVTWSSSDQQIATVSSSGLAEGFALGGVTFEAVAATVSGTLRASVDGVRAAAGSASIDGTLSLGEWNGANSIPVTVIVPGGTTSGRLFVMNDSTDLYLAFAFARTVVDPGNSLSFEFDSNHDGKLSSGDDGIILNPSPTTGFRDLVRFTGLPCPANALCSRFDTDAPGGTNDGAAAFLNDGTTTVYEFRHPLNSGDPNDAALASGDRVGLTMSLRLLEAGGALQDTDFPGLLEFMPIEVR